MEGLLKRTNNFLVTIHFAVAVTRRDVSASLLLFYAFNNLLIQILYQMCVKKGNSHSIAENESCSWTILQSQVRITYILPYISSTHIEKVLYSFNIMDLVGLEPTTGRL